MKSRTLFAAAGLALVAAASHAQVEGTAPVASAAAATAWTSAEVRKIDTEQGRLTLRHGDIANLGMPGMTMVFRVTDPTMLSGLKEGDKVRFKADRVGGSLAVTAIEPAN